MYNLMCHIFGSLGASERAVKSLEKSLRRNTLLSIGLTVVGIGCVAAQAAQIKDLQQRVEELEGMTREGLYKAVVEDMDRCEKEYMEAMMK